MGDVSKRDSKRGSKPPSEPGTPQRSGGDSDIRNPSRDRIPTLVEAGEVSAAADAELRLVKLGRALGNNYTLVSFVAAGGMGAVYLAMDEVEKRLVAIKVVATDGFTAPHRDLNLRFAAEMVGLSRVRDPNVVRIYDYGGEGNSTVPFYMVMEYLQGPDLAKYIDMNTSIRVNTRLTCKNGRVVDFYALKLDEALKLFRPIASGVGGIHKAGMVHRDLKPSNVVIEIDPTTGEVRPVVIDFGLVKLSPGDNTDEGFTSVDLPQTASGVIQGTVAYMCYQQVRGERIKSTDFHVDTYSLACMFYEMLTGFVPYVDILYEERGSGHTGDVSSDLLAWVGLHGNLRPLLPVHKIRPELPKWLDPFFQKALSRSAAMRFQSIDEMLRAIDDGIESERKEQERLEAANRTTVELGGKRDRRNRLLLVGAVGVVTAALSTLGMVWIAEQIQGRRSSHVDAGQALPPPMASYAHDAPSITDVTPEVPEDVAPPADTGTDTADAGGAPVPATPLFVHRPRSRVIRRRVPRCGDINPATGTFVPCGRHGLSRP